MDIPVSKQQGEYIDSSVIPQDKGPYAEPLYVPPGHFPPVAVVSPTTIIMPRGGIKVDNLLRYYGDSLQFGDLG